jgi:dTDP-4-amino-4,6-dideoxygalactose transaminase
MIYYPIPLHKQNAFKDARYSDDAFPVTDMLCDNVISLPIHTEMEPDEVAYILENTTQTLIHLLK